RQDGRSASRSAPSLAGSWRDERRSEGVPACSVPGLMAGTLVRKETECGDEADVSQRYIVADQEHPIRLQSLLDAGGVGRQRLLRAGLVHGRNLGLAQGKEVELRGAGEDQARVEKTVDARCLVRISPVEREPLVPEPGDGAHDAVRLEDADPAVG